MIKTRRLQEQLLEKRRKGIAENTNQMREAWLEWKAIEFIAEAMDNAFGKLMEYGYSPAEGQKICYSSLRQAIARKRKIPKKAPRNK